MYPLLQSPIPTTSGIAPHKSDSSFKPIHLAAPSTASGPDTRGSSNTLLNMVNSSLGTGSSQGSSIPCAQKSPEQLTSTGISAHPNNLLTHYSKMLHKGSVLQQTNRHLSNHLLHPSNSHHCYSPQSQAHMLPQDSRVSHNVYSQWLAHEANLEGNQCNLHHLGKHSTHLLSLSFQQQRHSKITLYPTHRSQKCQNPWMGKVSRIVDQMVIYVSAVDNWDI